MWAALHILHKVEFGIINQRLALKKKQLCSFIAMVIWLNWLGRSLVQILMSVRNPSILRVVYIDV